MLRPLPKPVRTLICRAVGLDPKATVLPPDRPRGLDTLRHPIRRVMEMGANARRVGPWTDKVVATAPDTDVFHCQSFIVLPVVHGAAKRLGARFVYDVADYHSEAARLARMPWMVRELVRRRERSLVKDAAGFLAVSDPVADLLVRRWKASPRPGIVLNCPPAWRPESPEAPVSAAAPRGGRHLAGAARSCCTRVASPSIAAWRSWSRPSTSTRCGSSTRPPCSWATAGSRASWTTPPGAHPDRVYVLPAVPPDELLSWTAGADVSFVGQPPRTLNQKMNLPNKLFESIMAGAPVVVSKGNEQCRLVTAEGLGRCADIDDPAAVAREIAALMRQPVEERQRLRDHVRAVALARYTWDGTAGDLVTLYRRLAAHVTGSPAPERRPKTVALLPNNPFLTDSRVWKIAGTLGGAGYDVTVVARAQDGLPARQDRGRLHGAAGRAAQAVPVAAHARPAPGRGARGRWWVGRACRAGGQGQAGRGCIGRAGGAGVAVPAADAGVGARGGQGRAVGRRVAGGGPGHAAAGRGAASPARWPGHLRLAGTWTCRPAGSRSCPGRGARCWSGGRRRWRARWMR